MYFNVLFETIENNLSLLSYLFFLTNLIASTIEKQNTPLQNYTIQFIKKQVLMYQLVPRINCINELIELGKTSIKKTVK